MKFVISTIAQPKVKLYFVKGNTFTINFNEAYKFENREQALRVQEKFIKLGLDTQIEKQIESLNKKA